MLSQDRNLTNNQLTDTLRSQMFNEYLIKARLVKPLPQFSTEASSIASTIAPDEKHSEDLNAKDQETQVPKAPFLIPSEKPLLYVKKKNEKRERRKIWQIKEDQQLLELYSQHGDKWTKIGRIIGGRTGKQVRDRYLDHLRPNVSKDSWTSEEDTMLTELMKVHGSRWNKIAEVMTGRTASQVKNRYHLLIRRSQIPKDDIKNNTQSPMSLINPADLVIPFSSLSHIQHVRPAYPVDYIDAMRNNPFKSVGGVEPLQKKVKTEENGKVKVEEEPNSKVKVEETSTKRKRKEKENAGKGNVKVEEGLSKNKENAKEAIIGANMKIEEEFKEKANVKLEEDLMKINQANITSNVKLEEYKENKPEEAEGLSNTSMKMEEDPSKSKVKVEEDGPVKKLQKIEEALTETTTLKTEEA